MTQRKHTRCSQCGFKVKARLLEVMWRLGFSGPWHYVGGWFCAACANGLVGFIGSLGEHQVVPD